jgi:hypothetical protein
MNSTLNNKTRTALLKKEIPSNETLKAMQEVKNGKIQEVSFEQLKEDMKKCIIN